MRSLPDYLALGLKVLFVGINPSLLSAQTGHYFANPRNRFWRAFNLAQMTPEPLAPETDYRILEFAMGFTDVVKLPTRSAADLTASDIRQGVKELQEKLRRYSPAVVCFQGLTAYRMYLRHSETSRSSVVLGRQPSRPGEPEQFVIPNPSPANAAFSLEELAGWYRQMKVLRDALATDG